MKSRIYCDSCTSRTVNVSANLKFVHTLRKQRPPLDLMRVQRRAKLVDMRSVAAHRFVELVAAHPELLRPVGNVRGHLRIDFLRVVWPLGVVFMNGVRLVAFRSGVMLRHSVSL